MSSSFHNNNDMSHHHLALQQSQQWASEAAPLHPQEHHQQQHQQRQPENYSTFQQHRHTEIGSKRSRPWRRLFLSPAIHDNNTKQQKLQDISTRSMMVILVLLVGLYMGHASNKKQQQQNEIVNLPHHTGTWIWDYNVYHNNNNNNNSSSAITALRRNNMLLTQIAGSRSLQELSDISSLPNRAYARQWRRDYVQICAAAAASDRKSESSLQQSCFTKVFVLQWLLEKHNMAAAEASSSSVDGNTTKASSSSNSNGNKATTTTTIPYDTVALLPPDAIVTDLDYDLDQLLPQDKLVAIAGSYWQATTDHDDDDDDNEHDELLAAAAASVAAMTDVVFFNLRHKHAAQVVQLWSDAVKNHPQQQQHVVTCGAGNDLQLLFQVMRSVVQNDEEKFKSMLYGLTQTEQGFIIGSGGSGNGNKDQDSYNRVIKSITPPVPACRLSLMLADMANSRAVLQTTADSVCYRYYPKCELL